MAKKDSRTKGLSEKKIEELRKKNPDIVIPDKDLKIDSFNKLLEKSFDEPKKSLKEIKKELKIKDADIAANFGYKNVLSYRNSDAKQRIDKGLEWFYFLIKNN